jgi:hypothetical protein
VGFSLIKQATKGMRKILDWMGLWPEEPHNQDPSLDPEIDSEIDLEKDAKAWELFQYFRSEIKHEHALLTGRVTWYITCQSFLLTVYAISYSNCRGYNWFSNIFLPTFSILLTFLALNMIQGAILTIRMWNEMRKHLIKKNRMLNSIIITRWRYPARAYDAIHHRSLWFPRLVPMLFMVAWIVIAIFSSTHPWLKPDPNNVG